MNIKKIKTLQEEIEQSRGTVDRGFYIEENGNLIVIGDCPLKEIFEAIYNCKIDSSN